jgi:hypothetical protein
MYRGATPLWDIDDSTWLDAWAAVGPHVEKVLKNGRIPITPPSLWLPFPWLHVESFEQPKGVKQ